MFEHDELTDDECRLVQKLVEWRRNSECISSIHIQGEWNSVSGGTPPVRKFRRLGLLSTAAPERAESFRHFWPGHYQVFLIEPTVCDMASAQWVENASGKTRQAEDSKPDREKKLLPENLDVIQLAKKINREYCPEASLLSIALDFTDGNEKRAKSLLRQLRPDRFGHLLNTRADKADN